ncbi:MAG: TetR/AcrR family transcriptional regulator [Solirubrobacterales bacterium]
MTDEKRPYRKKARAEAEAETRRRITESAVELHGTLGPAHTTMSAIADHAGVRRSTLYRHFPDEEAVFGACSAHWTAENPLPDPTPWAKIGIPADRLARALADLYPYYRRNERMLANLHRDQETMPVVAHFFAAYGQFIAAVRDMLLEGRGLRGRRRALVAAAAGHAIAFRTWQSLAGEQGLTDEDAAALMCGLVEAAETIER